MARIELYNLGLVGVQRDLQPYKLPPEAFTNGKNVRFTKRGVRRFAGHVQIMGTPEVNPLFILNVPDVNGSFWIYTDLEKAYVYEGGVHTNITRQDEESADDDYAAVNARDWNGTLFGGIPILNNGIDVPQYWPDIDINEPLADLEDWPATLRAKLIRTVGPYLVALNLNDDGTLLPHSLQWSHKADPGSLPASWDYTDPTVDAGRTHLTDVQGGEITWAEMLGNQLIIYKRTSTHAMRFVGGSDLWGFDLLFTTSGVLAPRCACAFKKGTRHFVLTDDDGVVHAGTKEIESVLQDWNRRTLFSELDSTNYANTFVFNNQLTNEVWICYPENGSEFPTKALVWNYKDNTQTFRDFDGLAVSYGLVDQADPITWNEEEGSWNEATDQWSSAIQNQMIYTNGAEVFALDQGRAFGDNTPISFVERTGISIDGKDRFGEPRASISSRKLLKRVWPKIEGTATLNIQVGTQEATNSEVEWSNTQTFNSGMDEYLDFEVEGKLLAYRIESNTNDDWVFEGIDLEVVRVSEM